MTIAALQKVTIAASIQDKLRVLKALQSYGQCHLINPENTESANASVSVKDIQSSEALKYLNDSKMQRRALTQQKGFNRTQVVAEILSVKSQLRELEADLEQTLQRITIVKPWGDFDFPPQQSLNHLRFWFYILPVTKRDALAEVQYPWQIVGRTNTRLFVVVIHGQEPEPEILPVERQHIGSRSLSELMARQEQLEQEIDEAQNKRYFLTRYRYLIEKSIIDADNKAFFQHSLQLCQNREGFFTLQFWLPENLLDQLKKLAGENQFAFSSQLPNQEELPPTLLQPNRLFKSGALLAKIYQMPGYRAWDPSAHLYSFFSIFFAMILSDAGYALLLGGALGIFWQRFGRSDIGKDLRWLAGVIVASAVCWGVLVGSYFGVTPNSGLLDSLHIIDLNNYQAMMAISVAVGVVHLCVANFAAVGHTQDFKRTLFVKAGWSGVTLGGFFWWMFAGQTVLLWLAKVLFFGGLLAVFIASGWRTINGAKSIFQFLLNGVMPLLNITKLFGDVLSYMRLFALGLASASLAITFNQLAIANMHQGGLALIAGILILVVGHTVNLMLAIMGGVVHGLRLNFIEFYNWSDPGEGYPFVPFAIKELPYD